jgi:hypothetical protein
MVWLEGHWITIKRRCAGVLTPTGRLRQSIRITQGGLMSQTLQRPTDPIPAWLVFSGVVIGIVGAAVTKHAEHVGELVGALGRRTATSDPATASPTDWGLGLLIVGAIVLLAGLVVIAVRRPR